MNKNKNVEIIVKSVEAFLKEENIYLSVTRPHVGHALGTIHNPDVTTLSISRLPLNERGEQDAQPAYKVVISNLDHAGAGLTTVVLYTRHELTQSIKTVHYQPLTFLSSRAEVFKVGFRALEDAVTDIIAYLKSGALPS